MGIELLNTAPYIGGYESKAEGVHIFAADADIDATASIVTTYASYAQLAAADTVQIVSAQAADTSQIVTVIGVLSTGMRGWEAIALNGTTAVDSVNTWLYVENCYLSALTAGNVTIQRKTGPATINLIAAGSIGADVVQHFSGTGKVPCITGWWAGNSNAAATVEFELRWYPAAASCLAATTGYRVLDRITTLYDATNYYVTGDHTRKFSCPIRLSSGGWIAVYATATGNNVTGHAGIHIFDV